MTILRRFTWLLLAVALIALARQKVSIVIYVRTMSSMGDFAAAEKALNQYRSTAGITAEYLEALSWIGRNRLAHKQIPEAEKNSADVRKLADAQLAHRKLDAEPGLPIALGASIEVEAQALAAQNRRDEAVVYLDSEIRKWQGTSIEARLQKNLNLLTLEGKPAPVLDIAQGLAGHRPQPLSTHRGHPVLIFMWAHWCADCKNEIAIVRKLQSNYGPKGLVVVAPTQHYGYIEGGKDAPRDVETRYIGQVFAQYYAGLGPVEVPLSEANFTKLGVSTTPTMLLVDGKGIVRLYNPGNATYEILAARIEAALKG